VAHDDKTEAPTPKKKRDARRKGQIPRSPELTTWGAVLVGSFVLPLAFGNAGRSVRGLLASTGRAIAAPDTGTAISLIGAGGRAVAVCTLPFAAVAVSLAVAGNVAQTGLVLSGHKLKPDFKKVNPFAGFKRMFSADSGWNLVKVLLRTGLLAAAAWGPLHATITALRHPARRPLAAIVAETAAASLQMVRLVAVAGLLLGVLDYAMARRRIGKQLKMTKQEVRDEHRNSEGDPLVRQQLRQRQREVSRNRMIAAVAQATVVIVNPTHVAVALRYEPGSGPPRLVAKGKGEVAARIRAEAEEHAVPMVRDVPLAWSIHDTCDLDRPIPAELFAAVAKVLAFVLTVGKRAGAFGGVTTLR
jgi:flagellar biosynthetic protein FlhB